MLGLYIHIPFCARRCPYCDFAIHVGAKEDFVADYVTMLRRELVTLLSGPSSDGRPFTSIFFGGGTPTLLDASTLTGLLQLVRDHAVVAPDAEISLEANPDGLSQDKLAELREAGWNRISMGAQSFDDEALRRIGRTHDGAAIEAAFAAARSAGFENISLDLMFALPGQSRESWHATLRRAIALQPEHLSCYALTIEAGTPFARRVEKGRLIPVADDAQVAAMQDAAEILHEAGFERYEVSNYARPGRECRHNLNYWRGGDYLAAGCGAHGHRNGYRWWNERDARRYVLLMREQGTARAGEEFLTARQRLSEIVMLGLRLREGFHLDEVSQRLSVDARHILNGQLQDLTKTGVVCETQGLIQLAPQSIPVADAVAARLMP